MLSTPQPERPGDEKAAVTAAWMRRLVISLAFLVWLILIIIIFNLLSHVATALLILVLAALISYALFPLVELFQRVMPRPLAILIVYLVILGVLVFIFYLLIVTSIAQIASLATKASAYFRVGRGGQASPITQILQRIGVTRAQLDELSKTVEGQLGGLATNMAQNVLPLISGLAGSLINVFLTAVISIYLIIDGGRVVNWVRNNAPLPVRSGAVRLLDILQHVVGGYIRGQVVLCIIVGLLVGVGMYILRVPYAILLGTLAAFLEFIPVLGTIVSGAICCLIALTQGWLTLILALSYFVLLHIFEGYILAPRIVGKAVGLHPVVSMLALVIGGELFGPIGAILASPVAGLLQSVLVSFWLYYRAIHKEQFANEVQDQATEPKP